MAPAQIFDLPNNDREKSSLNPRFNLLSSTASGATAIIAGINSYEAELHARSSSELFSDPLLPPHATNQASLSDRRKLSEVASQKIGETIPKDNELLIRIRSAQ